eukprot:CAMPEP_0172456162 /NCGR_PEP_ID=MMETSP1065-20121228/14234_1 /TAXON_ID=265537 /ORGANISM="Amphiprora paludosa, Strain CCMP125" /LENGTH=183 /DNA_ID=CAMNT_0013208867 /DNA_START=48 /DNA_END=599 /DNA_ORIENTATION=-
MSDNSVLSLPNEWEHDNVDMDEAASAASSEEASKVFEQWQTEGDEDDDGLDMMEMDDKMMMGSGVFVDYCPSPTSPMDEFDFNFGDDVEMDKFSESLLGSASDEDLQSVDDTSSLSFQQRYEATLQKLAESMKRSQETRKSLVMKTKQMEHYARSPLVTGVVESIETSSRQLQVYLKEQASSI